MLRKVHRRANEAAAALFEEKIVSGRIISLSCKHVTGNLLFRLSTNCIAYLLLK